MPTPVLPSTVWRGPRVLNNGALLLQTTDTLDFTNLTLSASGYKTTITASASTLTGTLPIANGGTGATSAADARTNLGLGTIATQAANNVSITGGSITGITDLAIADGGTGASTAAGALTNLGFVAWSTFSPTVTSSGGTLGSATTACVSLTIGKNVFFTVDVTITGVGTGTGNVNLAGMPATAARTAGFGGVEIAVAGYAVTMQVGTGSTNAFIRKYDATNLIVANHQFVITGCYEST